VNPEGQRHLLTLLLLCQRGRLIVINEVIGIISSYLELGKKKTLALPCRRQLTNGNPSRSEKSQKIKKSLSRVCLFLVTRKKNIVSFEFFEEEVEQMPG
jgi:hypothetical protein